MAKRQPEIAFLRILLAAFAVGSTSLAAGHASAETSTEPSILARAKQIHERIITLDTHVDIAGTHYATEKLDPGVEQPKLKCDLVKMAAGGVDGVFLAVWVGQAERNPEAYQRALDLAMAKLEAIRRLPQQQHPDRCELATSPEDVRRIAGTGKRAIMIGVENGYPIGIDPANLKKFYDLGVRYVTLCHFGHNQICDSSNPRARLGDQEREHEGLSEFGKQVVAEMNRLGMMIDVSHVAPESFWDVIELSKAPVIASHSGCRALCDNPRNLDDAQLEALAKNGGVIQVVTVSGFLKRPSPQRQQAVRELAQKIGIPMKGGRPNLQEATDEQRQQYQTGMQQIEKQYPRASLEDYLNHIDHAVQVAGVEHVGIGSDFDGGGGIPGFNDHSEALNVTVGLLRRGYSEEDLRRIWGENLLRVWRDVEQAAAALEKEQGDKVRAE